MEEVTFVDIPNAIEHLTHDDILSFSPNGRLETLIKLTTELKNAPSHNMSLVLAVRKILDHPDFIAVGELANKLGDDVVKVRLPQTLINADNKEISIARDTYIRITAVRTPYGDIPFSSKLIDIYNNRLYTLPTSAVIPKINFTNATLDVYYEYTPTNKKYYTAISTLWDNFTNAKMIYILSAHALIDSHNIYPVLYQMTQDIKSTKAKETLNQIVLYQQHQEKLKSTAHDIIELENTAKQYVNIIREIFGARRLELRVLTPSAILKQLSKTDANLVSREYTKRINYWESLFMNRCPHIKLSRKLCSQPSLISNLQLYFGKLVNGFITCNNCGFNIICSHVRDLMKLKGELAPREVREKLAEYIDNQSSISLRAVYCKYCSEEIMHKLEDELSTEEINIRYMDSEIKGFLWSVLKQIYPILIFRVYMTDRQFISRAMSAALSILPILDHDRQANMDDRLYVVIAAHAYILKLVAESYITIRGYAFGAKIQTYVEFLLNNIMRFNVHRNITAVFIKNKYLKAYSLISGSFREPEQESQEMRLLYILKISPIFRYFASILRIEKHISDIDVFETIFQSLPKIMKAGTIFIGIIPKFAEQLHIKSAFDQLHKRVKNPGASLASLHTYHGGNEFKLVHTNDAFLKLVQPFKSKRRVIGGHLGRPHIDFELIRGQDSILYEYARPKALNGLSLFAQHVMKKPDIMEKMREFTQNEIAYREFRAILSQPPAIMLWSETTRQFIKEHLPISVLYDESGNSHIWDKPIYSNRHIVDKECTICGIRQSQINKLNVDRVTEQVLLRRSIDLFYTYYDTLCPTGDIHIWQEKKCKKCNLISGERTVNFYKKYKDIFNNQRRIGLTQVQQNEPKHSIILPPVIPFKFDYSIVVETAKMADISPIMIMAFGNYEGRTLEEIHNESNASNEPTSRLDSRIDATASLVYDMLFNYNMANKGEINQIDITFLPEQYRWVLSPTNMILYNISKYCEIICKIAILMPEFACAQISETILNESRTAKNKPFNFKVFSEIDMSTFTDNDFHSHTGFDDGSDNTLDDQFAHDAVDMENLTNIE